ncbi:hypothetical protein JOM56_009970 [Amanita muscaria]
MICDPQTIHRYLISRSVSTDRQIKKELSDYISLDNTSMYRDRRMKKGLSDGVSLANTSTYRDRFMQSVLNDIPPEFFHIWGGTLGYERGPRPPPEFSEEGVLTPTAMGYDYQIIRRRGAHAMSASSQLPPAGQVELEDSFPTTLVTLLPPTNENEMGSPNSASWLGQTSWASTDSTYLIATPTTTATWAGSASPSSILDVVDPKEKL